MMSRRMATALGLLACLALAPLRLSAQEAASDPPTYRVAGRVVSARDGHPLSGAVELLKNGSQQAGATAAGEDGSFAFPKVTAGTYVLQGQARGFIGSRYQGHGVYSTAVILGTGADAESLVLQLTPEASLSGHVVDEMGDPVRHASIGLYRENLDSGEKRVTRFRIVQTDDLGEYEIGRLPEGTYYLSASAMPWYAVHPQNEDRTTAQAEYAAALAWAQQVAAQQAANGANAQQAQQARAMLAQMPATLADQPGVVQSVDPTLDVAYPMTFYPAATDSSGAEAIVLKGGEQETIDLRLSPQPAVTLTIPHPQGLAQQQQQFPALQRAVFDGFEPVQGETRGSSTAWNLVGLAPGRYVLKETASGGGVSKESTVDLGGRSASLDTGWGEDLGNLKVTLKGADGGKLPPQVQVSITGEDGRPAPAQMAGQKGEMQINGLKSGDYRLTVSSGAVRYSVREMTVDGKRVAGNGVHVVAGSTSAVSAVATPGTGKLDAVAQKDGKPAAGAMVLLLSADDPSHDTFWKQQSDLDGSFEITGIPPGKYTLLAIEDGWDLEWQRDAVLAKYLPQGVGVVIPERAAGAVKVSEPVVVQTP